MSPNRAQPLVVIIVLNWNGRDDTVACVESVRRLRYGNARALIVDNGSTDDSVAVFAQRFPDIRCIQTGANLGFAEGNNVGMRTALAEGADYVFLLNNDATIHPDALDRLVAAGESRSDIGIVGPKIYYAADPKRIWYAGGTISPLGRLGHEGWNRIDDGRWDAPRETGYVTGCAFLVKRGVLEKVGLFAPEYFLLFEEADLCVRARRAGFRCWVEPRAIVRHKVSSSFGGFSPQYYYYFLRNYLLFQRRHVIPEKGWAARLAIASYLVRVFVYHLFTPHRGGWRNLAAAWEGIRDALRGRWYQRAIHRLIGEDAA
ncbi:MAG TPA: glycosyltransferase family 2 protein [Nitrospiria bacterium]|nr:glycosyltransferase family 2 protein [Nitrospiria bacterium]